jgi:hypothetical protein
MQPDHPTRLCHRRLTLHEHDYGYDIPAALTVEFGYANHSLTQPSRFTVTGTVAIRSTVIAAGCIHDEIVKHWPDLATIVHVHLADGNGEPMHAWPNAAYWAGLCWFSATRRMAPDHNGQRWVMVTDANGIEWAPAMLAEHLRCSIDEATAWRDEVAALCSTTTPEPAAAVAQRFADVCTRDGLPDRWRAEAAAAFALLDAEAGIERP